jgi:diguanylate cyclase (GGDEF)-like protein
VELDGHTLLISGLAMRTSFGVVFLALWLRIRGDGYLRDWGLASVLVAAAFLVVLATTPPGAYLGMATGFLAYGLAGLGLTLLWTGLRRFDRRRIPPALAAATTLAAPLAYCGILAATGKGNVAFASVFAGLALPGIVFVVDLLSAPGHRRLASRMVAAGAFVVFIAGFAAAAVVSLQEFGPNQPAVSSDVIVLAVDQVVCLFSNVGLLAMSGERARAELEWLATRDPLTGLLNRRGLLLEASRHLADPVPGRTPLAVLVADIDAFKLVNDRHGHATGDAVLMRFAAIAREVLVGERDLVARYGGEEFICVLPDCDLENARRAAERLRRATEGEPFAAAGSPLALTVSIGIAAVAPDEDTILPAVARADAALYEAKQSGRNRVVA